MKKRTKVIMERMLIRMAGPVKTVAARNAGEGIVPKSSKRPRKLTVHID